VQLVVMGVVTLMRVVKVGKSGDLCWHVEMEKSVGGISGYGGGDIGGSPGRSKSDCDFGGGYGELFFLLFLSWLRFLVLIFLLHDTNGKLPFLLFVFRTLMSGRWMN
jgi:hypothetical protein